MKDLQKVDIIGLYVDVTKIIISLMIQKFVKLIKYAIKMLIF
jgi:hypothetical protein